ANGPVPDVRWTPESSINHVSQSETREYARFHSDIGHWTTDTVRMRWTGEVTITSEQICPRCEMDARVVNQSRKSE
ncbi:MAG: hypothetical protein VXV86_01495, partial [Verrucomicrobiota bacterium]|nr:hypothetical protein [Verrucomicrobiota bacterium]